MPGPEFRRPPVIERVLTVQFQELHEFDVVHYGKWHDRVSQDFPRVRREHRLERIVEPFPFRLLPGRMQLELDPSPPLPRLVCAEDDRDHGTLLQIQPDRFAMNWRREVNDGSYPRFEDTSTQFRKWFEELHQVCVSEKIQTPVVDMCEVTYVNRMVCPPGATGVEYLGEVLHGLCTNKHLEELGVARAAVFNQLFDLPDRRGRLYAEASVGAMATGEYVLLKLTGRALVESDLMWSDRLTSAHDWVVNGFVALTKESIRASVWEQVT